MRPAGRVATVMTLAWVLVTTATQAQELQWVQWSVEDGGNGHEYAVLTELGRWHEQQAIAEGLGAHLVTISDAAEQEFVRAVMAASEAENPYSAWYYWIGLAQDPGSDEPAGGWRWVTGELLDDVGYVNWAFGEPNDSGGFENVAAMYKANGRWNDGNQNSWLRAIIEREGQAADETPPVLNLDPADPSTLPYTAPGVLTPVSITGQVTDDDSGVASATLTVTDEYGECDAVHDITGLLGADGSFATTVDLAGNVLPGDTDGRSYTVSLTATDNAGNEAEPVSVSVLAPPDTTPPATDLYSPEPPVLSSDRPNRLKSVTISGSVTDSESGVDWAVVSVVDEYGTFDAEYDVTGLLDGGGEFALGLELSPAIARGDRDGRAYEITLTAGDRAGNEASPISVMVVVERPGRDNNPGEDHRPPFAGPPDGRPRGPDQ